MKMKQKIANPKLKNPTISQVNSIPPMGCIPDDVALLLTASLMAVPIKGPTKVEMAKSMV